MRCRQAKQKLNAVNFDNSEIANDQSLLNHLNECSACASLVTAERSLRSDFQEASVDDTKEVISDWLLKAQVERQAASDRSKFRENHLMAIFSNLFKKQSKLTIGVTTVAVVLLLSVLIPFSYNKTIGYEVAFAGVDKHLALDSSKIQELLAKLGIENVDIDVSGCETTCNVKISDLKSTDDAKLVVAAFNEIDHVVVLEEIKEMVESETGNIFKKFTIEMSSGDNDGDIAFIVNTDDMHNMLIEKLGDSLQTEIMIWVSDSINCDSIDFDIANNAFFFSDGSGTSTMDIQAETNDDGTTTITVNGGTPDEKIITLPANGEFDDETKQMLEDMGLNLQMLQGNFDGDGEHGIMVHKVIEIKIDSSADGTDANSNDPNASAKIVSELPEGFELSQNYPNPFNPTTTINFSIPTSQHVSLEIINVRGQVVKTLVDQQLSAGSHSYEWDATNAGGSKVASGVYLYKLATAEDVAVKKMTLLK